MLVKTEDRSRGNNERHVSTRSKLDQETIYQGVRHTWATSTYAFGAPYYPIHRFPAGRTICFPPSSPPSSATPSPQVVVHRLSFTVRQRGDGNWSPNFSLKISSKRLPNYVPRASETISHSPSWSSVGINPLVKAQCSKVSQASHSLAAKAYAQNLLLKSRYIIPPAM